MKLTGQLARRGVGLDVSVHVCAWVHTSQVSWARGRGGGACMLCWPPGAGQVVAVPFRTYHLALSAPTTHTDAPPSGLPVLANEERKRCPFAGGRWPYGLGQPAHSISHRFLPSGRRTIGGWRTPTTRTDAPPTQPCRAPLAHKARPCAAIPAPPLSPTIGRHCTNICKYHPHIMY